MEIERELNTVWAMADRDASGIIDASELAKVMSQLNGGKDPSPAEVYRVLQVRSLCRQWAYIVFFYKISRLLSLMQEVDSNHDGVISRDEFDAAMRRWLTKTGEVTGHKRPLDDAEGDAGGVLRGRKRLHREVASFFTQFSIRHNFELRIRHIVGTILHCLRAVWGACLGWCGVWPSGMVVCDGVWYVIRSR
jgi:hypothetical protein